jgi:DNA adenine methylase
VAEKLVPLFPEAILADVHPDLVLMWQAALDGWRAPTTLSEEDYERLRNAEPSALRGFAGFPCSFGGKWFGGYARDPRYNRNYADVASRSLTRKAQSLAGATVVRSSYEDLVFDRYRAVVYADPPYEGVTAYKGTPPFDHGRFWSTMETWASDGADVFVSSYAAPDWWSPIWEREVDSSLSGNGSSSKVREKLFVLK